MMTKNLGSKSRRGRVCSRKLTKKAQIGNSWIVAKQKREITSHAKLATVGLALTSAAAIFYVSAIWEELQEVLSQENEIT